MPPWQPATTAPAPRPAAASTGTKLRAGAARTSPLCWWRTNWPRAPRAASTLHSEVLKSSAVSRLPGPVLSRSQRRLLYPFQRQKALRVPKADLANCRPHQPEVVGDPACFHILAEQVAQRPPEVFMPRIDRKSTRLNSSH